MLARGLGDVNASEELLFTGEFPPMKGGIGSLMYARCLCPPSGGLTVAAANASGAGDWDQVARIPVHRFQYRHGSGYALRLKQLFWARKALRHELRRTDYRRIVANVLFPFGWVAARMKQPGQHAVLFCHGAELLGAQTTAIGKWIFRDTVRRMDLLVANSLLTEETLTSLGCNPSKICVIPPPVDTKRFHPNIDGTELRRTWTGFSANGPVLLTVCRLDTIGKGVDTLLHILPRLRRRFPEIRYVVVGDGANRADYEEQARRNGVDDSTIFAGRVSDEDLPRYFAACDAFILLSRKIPALGYYEGFGIVYREAMACGKPVIVSDEAGFRDYVDAGQDGFVVSPRDPDGVYEACAKVLADSALRTSMGRRAIAFASRPPDWSPLSTFEQP